MEKLSDQDVQEKMAEIDAAWIVFGKFLHREFVFKNFVEAFSFITGVALLAERRTTIPIGTMPTTRWSLHSAPTMPTA